MANDPLNDFDLSSELAAQPLGIGSPPFVPQQPTILGPGGSTIMGSGLPPAGPQMDMKKYGPLLAMIPVVAKSGGMGAVAALLRGFQQSQQQQFQNAHVTAADQRAAAQQESQAGYRQSELEIQRQKMENERQREQGAFRAKIATTVPTLQDPETANAFLKLMYPEADRLGVGRGELDSFVLQTLKPDAMERKAAQGYIDKLEKTYGQDWAQKVGSATFVLPGAPVDPETQKPRAITVQELLAKSGLNMAGIPQKPEKADLPNTSEEHFYQAYARENGYKDFESMPTAKQREARTAWTTAGPVSDQLRPAMVPDGKGGQRPGFAVFNPKTQQLEVVNTPIQPIPPASIQAQNAPAPEIKPGTTEYKVAEDLASGKLTLQQFRSLYSYSRDANKKLAIYTEASKINPDFNPAEFEAGFKLASNPKTRQQLASLDNVLRATPDLISFSDQASRTGITALNGMVRRGGYMVGGRRYSNFKTAVTAYADELSGALGYGSATDMSREMGFSMTDGNLSPADFASAMRDVVTPFVERKRDTLMKQMGPYGQSNPAAPGNEPAAPNPAQSARDKLNKR